MYSTTIEEVRRAIGSDQFVATPNAATPDYLMGMCDAVEKMTDSKKAGRWIGWILAHCEMHECWSNEHSRTLIRIDVINGDD